MVVEFALQRILRIHKKWADGITIIWQIILLALFGGIFALTDYLGVTPEDRNAILIFLGTMVVVTAVWQAAGYGIARVHILMREIDLKKRDKADTESP